MDTAKSVCNFEAFGVCEIFEASAAFEVRGAVGVCEVSGIFTISDNTQMRTLQTYSKPPEVG